MKKIVMLMLALLFVFAGCSSKKSEDLTLNSTAILEKIEADESFVFYVGTTTCSACITYKPIVKEMNKNYDVNLYAVMLDQGDDDEAKQTLIDLVGLTGTPTTVVIENGEIKKSYVGVLEYTDLKKFLVNNGVIKE